MEAALLPEATHVAQGSAAWRGSFLSPAIACLDSIQPAASHFENLIMFSSMIVVTLPMPHVGKSQETSPCFLLATLVLKACAAFQ